MKRWLRQTIRQAAPATLARQLNPAADLQRLARRVDMELTGLAACGEDRPVLAERKCPIHVRPAKRAVEVHRRAVEGRLRKQRVQSYLQRAQHLSLRFAT